MRQFNEPERLEKFIETMSGQMGPDWELEYAKSLGLVPGRYTPDELLYIAGSNVLSRAYRVATVKGAMPKSRREKIEREDAARG